MMRILWTYLYSATRSCKSLSVEQFWRVNPTFASILAASFWSSWALISWFKSILAFIVIQGQEISYSNWMILDFWLSEKLKTIRAILTQIGRPNYRAYAWLRIFSAKLLIFISMWTLITNFHSDEVQAFIGDSARTIILHKQYHTVTVLQYHHWSMLQHADMTFILNTASQISLWNAIEKFDPKSDSWTVQLRLQLQFIWDRRSQHDNREAVPAWYYSSW